MSKSIVYWIDDVGENLERSVACLEELVDQVVRWASYSEAVDQLNAVRKVPGPIIVDLKLPAEERPEIIDSEGPEIGLKLIDAIFSELGEDWPVFVLSGNCRPEIRNELIQIRRIPSERVFDKPLLDEADDFVKLVAEQSLLRVTAKQWSD